MKLLVYTAVIGEDTDALKPVRDELQAPGIDYVCVTDLPLKEHRAGGWQMRVTTPKADPVREARRLKILQQAPVITSQYVPTSGYDVTLWIDAAYQLKFDPLSLADAIRQNHTLDVLALAHPDRDTVEAEGEAVIRHKSVPRELIAAQLDRYRREGFLPQPAGEHLGARPQRLTTTGFLMRRNCERVRRFNHAWWSEMESCGHTRDQMSVDYAAWKSGVEIEYLDGHYRSNRFAVWSPQSKAPAR